MRITVLGAGYMGSAMAKVAAARGHAVRLWGTWLDDALLEPVERGEVHPRLKLPLTELTTLRADRLQEALSSAELVIHAVNSDGALAVMTRAAPFLPDVPILSVTKGFLELRSERMDRIDAVVSEAIGRPLRFVHASGPAKAMEVARGVLTWMSFAGPDAAWCAEALRGGRLQIGVTDDLAGAEICSALKNAYATGLGLWDGVMAAKAEGAPTGCDVHNARAACFTQAIAEMRTLVVAGGGRAETVHGAAGVGDLHVTAAGGRNRAFGERVGRGRRASEVAKEMLAEGELTEGYPAIATASRYARERGVHDLPLLHALHAIIWEDAPVAPTLARLALSV
jgi:glycerol-3-phosphate dehydrogenase (NAD(P)+)